MNSETGVPQDPRPQLHQKGLGKDLAGAVEFDRSSLFKKVYEEEYGTFGGAPFGLLVGDYDLDGSTPDVDMLTSLSGVAAAAHAPFLAAAVAAALRHGGLLPTLDVPGDLGQLFERTHRAVAQVPHERRLALRDAGLPARAPPHAVRQEHAPRRGFAYEEQVVEYHGLPLGQRRLRARAAHHQRASRSTAGAPPSAASRAVVSSRACRSTPSRARGGDVIKCPTEVAITDRRASELSEPGLLALCYKKHSNEAAFFGGATLNKPTAYNIASASANARLSAQLPYILATSRFAHYIKVMMRDKIGSFASRENVAYYLNSWIADYVLLSDDAGQDTKARLPLRGGAHRRDRGRLVSRVRTGRSCSCGHFQLNEPHRLDAAGRGAAAAGGATCRR